MEPLTNRQARLLLDALMYRATPDQRDALMHELPEAYNAYVGEEIVRVVKVSDVEQTFIPAWCIEGQPVRLIKFYDSSWPNSGKGLTGIVHHARAEMVIVRMDDPTLERLEDEDDHPFVTLWQSKHGVDAVSKFLEPVS